MHKTLHWTFNNKLGPYLKAYEGFFRLLALFIVVALYFYVNNYHNDWAK